MNCNRCGGYLFHVEDVKSCVNCGAIIYKDPPFRSKGKTFEKTFPLVF